MRDSTLALAWILVAGGCAGVPDGTGALLGRPALTAEEPLRVAFTARGRVWVADAPAERGGVWRARMVPGDGHQDRPAWLPGGESLALSAWFDGQADLAVYDGAILHRLTRTTAAGELVDDVAGDGRLLFEREGFLVQAPLERGPAAGEWRLGTPETLGPGRDAHYAPGGQSLLLVRGHDSDPLGVWRRGYRGGDESDVYALDLDTASISQVTSTPGNDENPVPLDDTGRRFVVSRERDGPFGPWLVDVVTPRIHRVRRIPVPGGEAPAVHAAVRRRGGDGYEVWIETGGRLFRTTGAVRDTGFVFEPAEEIRIELAGAPPRAARAFGTALYDQATPLIARGPVTRTSWSRLPAGTKRRFRTEMARSASREGVAELFQRLLGRLDLPDLAYTLDAGGGPPLGPATDPLLAGGAVALGFAYRAAAGADSTLLDALEIGSPLVLDLRRARGGAAAGAALARAARAGGSPLVVLISEKTYGAPELLADGLRARRRGRLAGRRTAGAVFATENHHLDCGGVLALPVAALERLVGGGGVDGRGVTPDVLVPAVPDGAVEPWLAVLRGQ